MKKFYRGFTLIELLVVVSIISMLSSIVLASLSTARTKAKTSSVVQFDTSIYHSTGDDIVGMWEMNEGSGSTIGDLSGFNNTGTFSAGVGWQQDTPTGSGTSIRLVSGSHVGVTIPASTNYVFGSNDYTFTLWAKPTALSGSHTYFENGTYLNGLLVRQTSSSQLDIYSNWGSGGAAFNFTYTPIVNEWMHLAITRTNGFITLYVNGNRIGQFDEYPGPGNAGNTNSQSSPGIRIGTANHADWQRYVGYIDSFRVYRRGLPVAEIQKIYAEGLKTHTLAVQ